MKESNCLISVAMIMKNEAHNLDRALGSIKPYVDEIVVVDTGSTDESVEIARKYTDKIYFFEWRDDFSVARNYSLQFPTCEWVLIYDADEEVKEDFAGLRDFLAKLPKDVNTVYLPTISYLDWSLKRTEVASTARIFRNGTVRYENIVHNQPIYKGRVVEAPFVIYHYGYIWTRKLKEKKYNRTKNLLVKLLNEKRDLSPMERMYYLCQLYKTESIYEYRYNKYPIVEEIYKILEREKKITAIGFEVLFLHGLDLLGKGFLDMAENLFKFNLSINPDNPDPYYGLLGVAEARKDYEKMVEYGERFFELLSKVEEHPEKFGWTIISIKYKAAARTLLSLGFLKRGDLEKFRKNYYLVFKEAEVTGEEIAKSVKSFSSAFLELDDEKYRDISDEIDKLLIEIGRLGLDMKVLDFIEKDLKSGRKINFEIYQLLMRSEFEKFVLKKLFEKSDFLVDYILGNNKIDSIQKYGVGALIFYFENTQVNDEEKLKFLNELRKLEDDVLKGVALAFIGDVYLKMGSFKLAIDYYKRAIDTLPEIAKFVRPVIDDLKTKLDTQIDGVFEEVKNYYLKNREVFTDLSKDFNVEELRRLYLISDTDFAKYVSAMYWSDVDKKKARELLDKIEDKEKFSFYNFRYAKLLERSENQDDLKKAYELHLEACKKNFNIGDLLMGYYPFDGFYPSEDGIGSEADEIIWVGNISEKHSGLGVISPIRMWKKAKDYYYAYPFPKDEVLKVYKDRLKNYRLPKYSAGKEELIKVLNELNWSNLRSFEQDEEIISLVKSACMDLGIDYDEESKNIVSFETLNLKITLEQELKSIESGVFFYFIPDFGNKDDMIWYYPYFRVFRNKKQIDTVLKNIGFRNIRHIVLTTQLRAVICKRI